jgi:drug/metabolite transporter (DMT)-like permease
MKAWLALAFTFVVMGGQFAVGKLGLRAGLTAYDIVALRVMFAALPLLPWLLARGFKSAAGVGWGRAIALALIAGSPYALLMFGALSYVPAAHGAMIVPGLTLVMGVALGALWLGEAQPPRRYAGAAIALAGLLLIGAHSFAAPGSHWIGDLLFCAAGLCWGLYSLLAKRWALQPLDATAALSVASLGYLPVYFLWLDPRLSVVPSHELLLQGAYHGILQGVLAMVGYTYAVQRLGAARVSVSVATVPVIGTLLAIALLGERPPFLTWIGLATVSLGMLVANWPRGTRRGTTLGPAAAAPGEPAARITGA